MLRLPSWRGWKSRPWAQRLFGQIYDPLTAAHGAAEFISSLPVIPASLSPKLESVEALTTRGTCGLKSPGLSAKFGPSGSFAKMSKGTSIWDLPPSPATLPSWAIAQRRACSRRLKLAQDTGATVSLFWPTPTVADGGYCPDIIIRNGTLAISKPTLIKEGSGGQYPVQNAARMWTATWTLLQAFGWKPGTSPSSPPVRLNFARGQIYWLRGLISNPRFYEALMGWPIGWTEPGQQATAFAAWLRQSRGLFSKLISRWPD